MSNKAYQKDPNVIYTRVKPALILISKFTSTQREKIQDTDTCYPII